MELIDVQSYVASNWQQWLLYDPKRPILFNSGLFLAIFLIFYALYIMIASAKTYALRNIYVVAFSLFFYYKSSGLFFLLLIFTSVFDYNIGRLMYTEGQQRIRKFYLLISVFVNLGLLAYFKYTNFFIDNYNGIFDSQITFYDIILPVGISFYTFQSMSYIIDI
nr:MBOAT family protein [Flavobacterium sp.]